jgi:hypothetical protein
VLLFNEKVFEDTLVGAGPWYTPGYYNGVLGSAEMLVIMGVVTNFAGSSPLLRVFLEFSADEVSWLDFGFPFLTKSSSDPPVISSVAGSFYEFTRLRIDMTGTTPQCRLKLYVTGRTL